MRRSWVLWGIFLLASLLATIFWRPYFLQARQRSTWILYFVPPEGGASVSTRDDALHWCSSNLEEGIAQGLRSQSPQLQRRCLDRLPELVGGGGLAVEPEGEDFLKVSVSAEPGLAQAYASALFSSLRASLRSASDADSRLESNKAATSDEVRVLESKMCASGAFERLDYLKFLSFRYAEACSEHFKICLQEQRERLASWRSRSSFVVLSGPDAESETLGYRGPGRFGALALGVVAVFLLRRLSVPKTLKEPIN